eukprot:gb/GFBE01018310.1/.p1 GENE.gb/GFBE01018310.1/~~gb/GFBE01018310.1/.p1  ORF type:complete len:119 (+),score=23.76 gb/GFBE01018310.1/:1-357(+)
MKPHAIAMLAWVAGAWALDVKIGIAQVLIEDPDASTGLLAVHAATEQTSGDVMDASNPNQFFTKDEACHGCTKLFPVEGFDISPVCFAGPCRNNQDKYCWTTEIVDNPAEHFTPCSPA